MTTSKKDVQEAYERALKAMQVSLPDNAGFAYGFDLETSNPGDGRRYQITAKFGGHNVSPLLPAREMVSWLDGWAEGLRQRYDLIVAWVAQKDCSHPAEGRRQSGHYGVPECGLCGVIFSSTGEPLTKR